MRSAEGNSYFVLSDLEDNVRDKLVCIVLFCRSVMLDRAETLLHDHYAGKDYWDVSKVMGQFCCFFNNVHNISAF